MGEQGVHDLAFEMASDDVLTAWRVRNAALHAAASFVHPGPDHADMTAREALVREWVTDGHDQVEMENRQRHQMLVRMIRAEDEVKVLCELASRLALHLDQMCEHYYERRYESVEFPCGGCFEAVDNWNRHVAGQGHTDASAEVTP